MRPQKVHRSLPLLPPIAAVVLPIWHRDFVPVALLSGFITCQACPCFMRGAPFRLARCRGLGGAPFGRVLLSTSWRASRRGTSPGPRTQSWRLPGLRFSPAIRTSCKTLDANVSSCNVVTCVRASFISVWWARRIIPLALRFPTWACLYVPFLTMTRVRRRLPRLALAVVACSSLSRPQPRSTGKPLLMGATTAWRPLGRELPSSGCCPFHRSCQGATP